MLNILKKRKFDLLKLFNDNVDLQKILTDKRHLNVATIIRENPVGLTIEEIAQKLNYGSVQSIYPSKKVLMDNDFIVEGRESKLLPTAKLLPVSEGYDIIAILFLLLIIYILLPFVSISLEYQRFVFIFLTILIMILVRYEAKSKSILQYKIRSNEKK